MATFFGEIPALSSRAVDEEDLDEQRIFELKIDDKSSSGSTVNCRLLIFSVGDLAKAFTKCYIIPSNTECLFEVLYSYKTDDSELLLYTGGLRVHPKGSVAATMYKVNDDVVICEVSSKIPEEINTSLCDTILQQIKCSEALVFTSSHMSSFKTEMSLLTEKPFLRSLCTSLFSNDNRPVIERLNPPNFLTGFPAAVLSEFEFKKKPAMCIINYVDTSIFNSLNVQNFESVFEEKLIVKLIPDPESQTKLEKIVKAAYAAESNLYV